MNKKYCASGFWNSSLFFNNKYPIFTDCFQFIILLIPCGIFLILFSIFLSFGFFNCRPIIRMPFDIFQMFKLSSQFTMISLIFLTLQLDSNNANSLAVSEGLYLLSYGCLSTALFLVIIQTEIRRRICHPVCPILFIFWFTGSIAYLIRFYSEIVGYSKNSSSNDLIVIQISGALFLLFLLNLFIEGFPRYCKLNSMINKENPCPEEYASTISKLTFSWFDSYIYKWRKEEMTEENSFELRSNDESKKYINLVEKSFLKKIEFCKEKSKQINKSNSSKNLLTDNEEEFREKKHNSGWILFSCLSKVFLFQLVVAWVLKLIGDTLLLFTPYLLKILLRYVNSENKTTWISYGIAFTFLANGILSSIMENYSYFMTSYLSVRIRAVIIGMIYSKTLRLSREARNKYTTGEIVNLMSVDAERIMVFIDFSWFIFSCPFQIIIATVLLYQEMNYAIFAGFGLFLVFLPLNGLLMKYAHGFSDVELKWKDERIKIFSEILTGIKVIKMYGWEQSFISKITGLRNLEVKYILRSQIIWGIVYIIWEILPSLIIMVMILSFVFMNRFNFITAEKAFVSLSLFNLIRFSLIIVPYGLTETVNAFVSLKRIAEYLMVEEMEPIGFTYLQNLYEEQLENDLAIEIQGGTFSWKRSDKVILNNINLSIAKGKLIAVVGKIGSGKSSLISAILGEMVTISGDVKIKGRIAYVSQEPWIQNRTLKNNILFTEDYNETFYKNVVVSCCLTQDLEQLPMGDETEIGERGINLSGGQKQRVSLARAVYQNRDIYLLDDPLSAVDSHVAHSLFENIISNNGILGGKTRVLITHGLNWLPKVDEIVVLDNSGHISDRGSFKDLFENSLKFKQFIKDHMNPGKNSVNGANFSHESIIEEKVKHHSPENDQLLYEIPDSGSGIETEFDLDYHGPFISKESSPLQFTVVDDADIELHNKIKDLEFSEENNHNLINRSNGQLIDEEQAFVGNVKAKEYFVYVKSRGLLLFLLTVLIYSSFVALQVFSFIWMEKFTEDKVIQNLSNLILKNASYVNDQSNQIRERTEFYMIRYSFICIAMIGVVSLFWVCFAMGTYNSMKYIHGKLLYSILRCPMEFFDTTPVGRILNRLSHDMDLMDRKMPVNLSESFSCFFVVLSSIIVIIYVTPWFAIVIIPLFIFYYFIQYLYMPTSRQSRRLDAIATSPVFNIFTETIQGISIIRACKVESYFQELSYEIIDKNSRFRFIQVSSMRWLCFRIDIIGSLVVFFAVILSITNVSYLTAGLVGLSISYSLQVTEALNWLLRQYTEVEMNMVALERIREYSMVPSEAEWNSLMPPPENWPNIGNIKFIELDLKYRESLSFVLKNINLDLNGGYKVGIVGRTGAGKSSLTLALFRLMEPSNGKIVIDGLDISTIGLHDLRKRLTILPQDPVIFSGTLRENLDPFNVHTDEDLYQCLETAHLQDWVSSLNEGMNYECGEGGVNLSAGQRQLLCLARALLRKSKILILDEATASVDFETDKLVMTTVKEYFRQSTVIIIAHRINTILDTDKIVVLDSGEVVEIGSPKDLLEQADGIFKSLHDQNIN